MGYFNFENGKTALNDTDLMAMQKELAKMFFPIGSTYITQDNTNPSTIFGFGTWERLKGKVCLGLDEDDTNMNTIGKTGGEKTHTLTVNEMPNHNHESPSGGYFVEDGGSGSNMYTQSGDNFATKSSTPNRNVKSTGGGQPHNNLQPYEVVGYMWIRRA